jgi:aminoglycoside phosphotransferase (APT) family kinase protein
MAVRMRGARSQPKLIGWCMVQPVRAEEIETDVELARWLIAAQFPRWVDLPIAPVHAPSTDNAMYRLGADMAVRLPRRASAALPIDKEHTWLPRLAPQLPLAVPVPLVKGAPDERYPYPWSVVRWLDGETPRPGVLDDARAARELSAFVRALHAVDTSAGPRPGAHNFWRGVPLQQRDAQMRERFAWLADLEDIGAIVAAWDRDSTAPPSMRAAVWIHGHLKAANLLCREERFVGVLDWSCAALGDPANDLAVAWTLFGPGARAVFRAELGVDDDTWMRGRAWALIEGVLALSYYRGKDDALAQEGRHMIDAVLADHASTSRRMVDIPHASEPAEHRSLEQ